MVTRAVDAPARATRRRGVRASGTGTSLSLGIAVIYLSLIVLIPLAALAWKAVGGGWSQFWTAVTSPEALAALRLTFEVTAAAVAINAVMGTLIAWVLVRDAFPGSRGRRRAAGCAVRPADDRRRPHAAVAVWRQRPARR